MANYEIEDEGGLVTLSGRPAPAHSGRTAVSLTRVSPLATYHLLRLTLYTFISSYLYSTMHTSEYDYLFKLLLIGDSGVGKVRALVLLAFAVDD